MASAPSGSPPSNSASAIRPRLSSSRRSRGILDARVKKLSANQCPLGRSLGRARCSHECKCHTLGRRLRAELLSLATRTFSQPVPLAFQLDSFNLHVDDASQVPLFFNTYGKFYHIRKFSTKFPDAISDPLGVRRRFESPEQIQPYIIAIKNLPFLEEISFAGSSLGIWAAYALAEALRTKTRLRRADFSDCFTGRLTAELAPALDAIVSALLALPNLESINLGSNAFGPDVEWQLVRLVSSATPLQELRINDAGIGPETGVAFAKALVTLAQNKAAAGAPPLRMLLFNENKISQDDDDEMFGMPEWAAAFAAHPNLQILDFSTNGVRRSGAEHLVKEGLSRGRAFEVLDLSDNIFASRGSTHRALADAVGGWPALRELKLNETLLGSRGAALLIPALAAVQPSKLQVLQLKFNNLNPANTLALAGVFWRLSELRELNLDENNILEDDEGFAQLVGLLQKRGEERNIVTTMAPLDIPDASQPSTAAPGQAP